MKSKNTGVGSLFLLQGILLTHGLNQGLLHCRQILHQLSYQDTIPDKRGFPGDSVVKNLPVKWETWVQSQGWKDSLEKEMATHSSILAWRIPMDRGAWQATVHGILQARILEWVAFAFSRGCSQTRDQPQVSLIAGGFFTS